MSADDPSEVVPVETSTTWSSASDAMLLLSHDVTQWLARRVADQAGETVVAMQVATGRFFLRVETGGCASTLEQPIHGSHETHDLVASVRRWARGAGYTTRTEGSHGSEARLALTPPVPSQS